MATQHEGHTSPPGPSLWKRLNDRLGLTWGMAFTMIKGASTPVIAIAWFQYPAFSGIYPTLGYLVAIVAILGMAIMPRAKFIENLLLSLVSVCVATAVSLLICYCCVQARQNTSIGQMGGSQEQVPYNSSASVISGIWLFFSILVANAVRFARHQMHLPMILYAIYANIIGTFAPIFVTMDECIAFIKSLLEAFLSGLAIATVMQFLFPRNCRQVTVIQFKRFVGLTRTVLEKQKHFMSVMEQPSAIEGGQDRKEADDGGEISAAAAALKSSSTSLANLFAAMRADLPFAKREVALGKLEASDFEAIFQHLRKAMHPILGLASTTKILTRIAEDQGPEISDASKNENIDTEKTKPPRITEDERQAWRAAMRSLNQPVEELIDSIDDGLSHAMRAFGLTEVPTGKPKAVKADVESPTLEGPGNGEHSTALEQTLQKFETTKKEVVEAWCQSQGISLEEALKASVEFSGSVLGVKKEKISRRQLYLILYLDFLLSSTGTSVLQFVRLADARSASGLIGKSHIVWPGRKRVVKWLKSVPVSAKTAAEFRIYSGDADFSSVELGASFRKRKDPEHLPVVGWPQRASGKFQTALHLFGRPEVLYGFRVACATLSIGVVDYLQETQTFFIQERLVWAMIMVTISMTMTTGSGVFGFLYRVLGTIVSTCVSLAIWYIAGARGIPAAVLPLLFVACLVEVYVMIKHPRLTIAIIISLITQVLILGYELGADKIGVKLISGDGSRYYPIYLMAPFRLATVVGGLAVALIFTYFPYPVTARKALRNQLGESIYLLANYHSCVHSTIQLRMSRDGDENIVARIRPLEKASIKILSEILALVAQLRQHSAFVSYEINFGGKFPKATYISMINRLDNLVTYVSLLDHSTASYNQWESREKDDQWSKDLRDALSKCNVAPNEVTSLLLMVSSSLINASPLPPDQKPPAPYNLTEEINKIDSEILSLRHFLEPGYAAFAVTEVASRLFSDELTGLLDDAKGLLGEVDFSVQLPRV